MAEGGVTLKIDADTAAYLAKLSQLADSHEKVTKHVDEWGHAADHALGKITAMAGPLVLIEELVRHTGEGIQKWHENLERAGRTASEVVDTLRKTTVQTGENRQAVESALMGVSSPQSVAARVAGFDAFRQNAPGSAGRVSAGAIAAQLGNAATAGYDPTQLAGIAGNVEGARPGGGSFDLAALLLTRTGSNADQASGLIRRLSEKAGPGVAQAALPYLLSSAQAGDRRFSFMTEAINAYTPAMGDFGAYMQTRIAGAKPDQRGLAGSIGRGLSGAQGDIAGLDGFLGNRAAAALNDPAVASRVGTATISAEAEIKNFHANEEGEEHAARRAAMLDRMEAVGGAEAVVAGAVHPAMKALSFLFNGKGRDPSSFPRDRSVLTDSFTGEDRRRDRLETLLEEQNAIHRTKKLRVNAHPDQ